MVFWILLLMESAVGYLRSPKTFLCQNYVHCMYNVFAIFGNHEIIFTKTRNICLNICHEWFYFILSLRYVCQYPFLNVLLESIFICVFPDVFSRCVVPYHWASVWEASTSPGRLLWDYEIPSRLASQWLSFCLKNFPFQLLWGVFPNYTTVFL